MGFFDFIRIGFKNIFRQKLRTSLTIIAVVIGSISVILMLSLVFSARRVALQQVETIGGLTLVTVNGNPDMEGGGSLLSSGNGADTADSKKLDDKQVASFKTIPHVVAATPVASIWAKSMKLEGETKRSWANTLAYDVDAKVFKIPITYGRGLRRGDMDKVVVGQEVLKSLGYTGKPEDAVGKRLIFLLDGNMNPDWGPAPEKPPMDGDKGWQEAQSKITKEIPAEIVGVASGGTDDNQSYVTMEWAKRMNTQLNWKWDEAAAQQYQEANANTEGNKDSKEMQDVKNMDFMVLEREDSMARNGYGAIILKVDKTANVAKVGEIISKKGFGVTTAQDMLDELGKMFTIFGLLAGAIGGIALFVAAIGIINTMSMATYERTREIGVMRACGATKATIRRLFTLEAALLGFIGGVIGLAASFLLAKIANLVVNQIAVSENLPISDFITFPIWLIAGVLLFTTLVGLMAGLYPAHRAARLDPVEALRYE